MNSNFSQLSNDERDQRLTALILGELSSAEAAELQHAINADPELARAFERRKHAIELIREAAALGEATPEDSVPLRLSGDRREKLMERFKMPASASVPAQPSQQQPRWYVPMSIAAVLIGLLVVATGMFENSLRTQKMAELELFSLGDSIATPEDKLADLREAAHTSGPRGAAWSLNVAKPSAAAPAPQSDTPVIGKLPSKDSAYRIALPQLAQEEDGKAVRLDGADAAGVPVAEAPSTNPFVARYSANDLAALPNLSQTRVTLNASTHSFADDVDAMRVRPNAVNGISSSPADSLGRNDFEMLSSTDRNGEAALRNPVLGSINGPVSGTGIAPTGDSRFFQRHGTNTQPAGLAQGVKHPRVSIAEQSVLKEEAEVLARRRNMPVDAAGLPNLSTDPNSSADAKLALREVYAANTEPILLSTEAIPLANLTARNLAAPVSEPNLGSLGDSRPSAQFGISSPGGTGGGGRGGGGFGGGGFGRSAFGERLGAAVQRSAGASGADQSGGNALNAPVEEKLTTGQLADLVLDSEIAVAQAQSAVGPVERFANLPGERRFYANNATESRSRTFANPSTNSASSGPAVLGVPLTPVPAPVLGTEVTYFESTRRPAEKLAELAKKEIDEAGLRTVDGSTSVAPSRSDAFFAPPKQMKAIPALPPRGEPVAAAKPAASAPTPQPEVLTHDNAFSTFSLNVSDVSFKLAAASLEKGAMPEAATIRSEEFINAFDYRDPMPAPGAPLAFAWERARYPFAHNRDVVRFSIKTAAQGREAGKPLNIVVLLDNSGSMERADRVRIIQESLRTLAAQLKPQDKLSVVTFSRTASLRIDGASGTNAVEVAKQIGALTPEGGTNLEDALDLAYHTALRHYEASAVNRIVLLTDGAANLGNVEPSSLKAKVENYRKQGIALDCFGIGWEGFNDDLLEQLSRNGDGRYGFVNTPEEAETEFVGQLAGALRVAASDVKMQVEFNPKRVVSWRQIGYAKHQLTKQQFRDNKVDAAEIGAAESGNALYVIEANPNGDGPIATVRARFRVPNTGDYREHEWVVPFGSAVELEKANPSLRLAATAAAFSEWLASSPFAGEVTTDRLLQILSGVPETCGVDPRPKKLEWMIRQAKSISGK